MLKNNICLFVPSIQVKEVNIFNFVYETKKTLVERSKILPYYRVHLVTEGTAVISIKGENCTVKEEDVFILFPSEFYSIEPSDNFKYVYISFTGGGISDFFQLHNKKRVLYVYQKLDGIKEFWFKQLQSKEYISDFAAKSALYYALTEIGKREGLQQQEESLRPTLAIIKYIDKHFNDPEISLEVLAEKFSYNKKYLSAMIKKKLKVNFTSYINVLRIKYACTLIEQKITSVKNISSLCGYSDQFYFSKIFKKNIGVSPKEYIKNKYVF